MKITQKFRPRNLSEVAAQKTAISQIENSIARSGLAGSSWWISGATGTGKTSIARILAEEHTQTDFTIYEFVGREVSVDDIREYESRMAFCPMGKGRCLIINEAQDLSDSVVSLLLSLVEKINESKYDMIVFTAMVDVLEMKNDPMNRWRALTGRCNQVDLADTDSPVFRQEVIEYLEGIAAIEGLYGIDIQTLCEKAGWSIRAVLNAFDMQDRSPVTSVAVDEKTVKLIFSPAVVIDGVVRQPLPVSAELFDGPDEMPGGYKTDEKVRKETSFGFKPDKVKVAKSGYTVKDRATTFHISLLQGRWRLTLTNHMTKAYKKGGRIQMFFSSLEEVESTYKCLKGLAVFVSNHAN